MWNLGLSLLSIAGALLLVRVTTNSVISPVQELTRASRRIAEGELEGACELPGNTGSSASKPRRDEIGILAESFGVMCLRLKQSMDEIQAWNRELDSRVQARTREALAAQEEAQEARDDFRAIIDALSDNLVVVDIKTDQVLQLNRAAQLNFSSRATGKQDVHLLGQPCCTVLHNGAPCKPPECECPRELIMQTGTSVKVTHVHLDPESGEERYIDIVASPLRNSSGEITRIVELMRDVTEERRIRESLVKKNQQLSILNSIANTVNQSLDLEQILGRTLEEVLRLTDIDIGAVFLQRDVLGALELVAYRGLSRDTALLASQMGLLDGSCGGVLEKGQIVIVPDIGRYPGRRARALRKENLNTLVHVPLTAKGFTLGSMCIGTCDQREFSPEDQELLHAIGSQIAVAIENARLYAEVQHKEQMRGELFKNTINAQEEERKRIARDLHDDTSQYLAALIYSTEEILEMNNLSDIRERLIDVRDLAQHTLDGVHKVIFDLRPTVLDHLGLVPALRWLAKSWLEPRGIRTSIEVNSDPRRLPAELETAIFRVLQEAITNIARHSAARNVLVWLKFSDYDIRVGVEDDGVGFELSNASDGHDQLRGLGLLGMEERIALLGGELEINSTPGNGTQINLRVPLAQRTLQYA
jgi:signal transduction histidine kinase/HAMP domain-containing protein